MNVRAWLVVASLVSAAGHAFGVSSASELPLLGVAEPRAFFMRHPEAAARGGNLAFEAFAQSFGRLDGVMGKALDEEIPDTERAVVAFFSRFKQTRPTQAVLLHLNGNARDPRWDIGEFFAGHWLYFDGSRVISEVRAQGGEAVLHVEDPTLFRVNTGRNGDKNEDLGLCALGEDGKPDWRYAEQLELLAVDAKAKTVLVRRGAFGTTPRAFAAGRAYLAAHATKGPWGKKANLLWVYNYALKSPRDLRGRSAGAVLAENLARRFQPGGELAAFDGIEFDVLPFDAPGGGRGRGVDTNADGRPDGGLVDGVNVFGLGVHEFLRHLRAKLGDEKLIMADGQLAAGQRSVGLLNGIESEGWPAVGDSEILDWSGGLNRHEFWRRNARPPVLNYVNLKLHDDNGGAARRRHGSGEGADATFSTARLVLAAGLFTDAAFAYWTLPPGSTSERPSVYDELVEGVVHKQHWLGRPLAPPVRLALRSPDLLNNQGTRWRGEFVRKLRSGNARFEPLSNSDALKISAARSGVDWLRFTLPALEVPDGDLFVHLRVKADSRRKYPAEMPRLAWVSWRPTGEGARDTALAEEKKERGGKNLQMRRQEGIAHPEKEESRRQRIMTWMNGEWFEAGFYFRDLGPRVVDLTFEFEGEEPVYLANLTAHAAADTMVRDYEGGVVLANPSTRPVTFDVATLFPGERLRRLQGTPEQDPQTNNGAPVGAMLAVGPRDAAFLVKTAGKQ